MNGRVIHTIGIDAMGGDHAPRVPVLATVKAMYQLPDFNFLIFGDATEIKKHLHGNDYRRIEIVHCKDAIGMDESVKLSTFKREDSSLSVMLNLLKTGGLGGVLSGGNTAVYGAMAKSILETIEGFERAALAAVLPGNKIMLDVGGNVDSTPATLLPWAIGGAAFAQKVQGKDHPVVALLSIGSGLKKGNKLVKETYPLLQEAAAKGLFRLSDSHIEPDKLLVDREVDVILTDGFSGNIALKAIEGASSAIKEIGRRHWYLAPIFLALKLAMRPLSYEKFNGAPFIGLRHGVVVKSHGRAGVEAYINAIRVVARAIESNLTEIIRYGVCPESVLKPKNQQSAL
ncbi:MAG: hypothetical protein WC227_03950 [Patescibacteria group bacterium]